MTLALRLVDCDKANSHLSPDVRNWHRLHVFLVVGSLCLDVMSLRDYEQEFGFRAASMLLRENHV